MQRLALRSVCDLMPAACSVGRDNRVVITFTNRREQDQLPYLHTEFVMVLFIAKASSHTAASGGN